MRQVQHGFERQKIQMLVLFVVEKQVQNKMLKIRVKVQVIRNQGNMSTGSELFALLGSGFAQILGQIIFKRVKALRNTNTGADLGGGCPPPLGF